WAGVRPVVGDGSASLKPSDEKREHALWIEPGCVTLAGGKLTTFRPLALEVLRGGARLVRQPVADGGRGLLTPAAVPATGTASPAQQRGLAGRHGRQLPEVLRLVEALGSGCVGATATLWAELAWAAEGELVLHLDDLLLRRTRLGLLLAHGGRQELPSIRALC